MNVSKLDLTKISSNFIIDKAFRSKWFNNFKHCICSQFAEQYVIKLWIPFRQTLQIQGAPQFVDDTGVNSCTHQEANQSWQSICELRDKRSTSNDQKGPDHSKKDS